MIRLIVAALLLLAGPACAQKLDETPRTVVMTAVQPEWDALVGAIAQPQEHRINGRLFLTGLLAGKPVILMQSGVSIVNAAMNTQVVIDRFAVKRIVFSGIAGGVDPGLAIGDVVVAENWGQYLESAFARRSRTGWAPPSPGDADSPANWFFIYPRGTVMGNAATAPKRIYRVPVDPELLALARKILPGIRLERCVPAAATMREGSQLCLPRDPRIEIGGTGVTAGVFADNAEFRIYLHKAWRARLLDMESAAVMQVAYSNMVPAIVFRSLSDLAGGDAQKNMIQTFARVASVNSARVVAAYVAALPD